MVNETKKVLGEKRRELIIQWLKENAAPITGKELSDKTNVSRQVIVQDISLLKAKNEPIIATSQGYMYIKNQTSEKPKRIIACQHAPEDTKIELQLLVDHGVTVRDVIVEHPVYGELTGSLMISNRNEVEQFINKIEETNATYLALLTDGVHLHTIEADTAEKIDKACDALDQANILLKE